MHPLVEERRIRRELTRGFPAAAGQVRDPGAWDPAVAWVHLGALAAADTKRVA